MVKLTDFIIRLSTLIRNEPLDRTLIDGRLSELSFSSWSITSEVMPGERGRKGLEPDGPVSTHQSSEFVLSKSGLVLEYLLW